MIHHHSSSIDASIGMIVNPPPSSSSSSSDGVPEDSVISLEERETRLSALLAESELAHAELSERMLDVYEKQTEKLTMLRIMEKTLSSQAGTVDIRIVPTEMGGCATPLTRRRAHDHITHTR